MDPISDLIECFAAWEPDVRVVGNVKAGDAHDALVALRARVADLESRLSSLDCRYAGAGIGEVSGSHCPADKPCDRCVAERRVAELEAELKSIADAKYTTWDDGYNTPQDFVAWVQNRCRFLLKH